MKQYICIDIGGTSIKYGVIQEDLTFLYTGEIPTEAQEHGGPGIVKKICKITEDFLKDFSPSGVWCLHCWNGGLPDRNHHLCLSFDS